jgi:hypothetical protein
MNSDNHVRIATYNTSFASDLGLVIGSEKHFLKRIENMRNRRHFFENSIKHAIDWCKAKNVPWGAIGFQEMNTPEKFPKYFDFDESHKKQHNDRGIEYTISKFSNELGDNKIRAASGAVYTEHGYPTVLTIWNPAVFGELKGSKTSREMHKYSYEKNLPKYVYVSDMETQKIIDEYTDDGKQQLLGTKPKPQGGRPILIVLTEREGKNYLLVNLHAPNRQPGNVELQMKLTAFCIREHIKQALERFDLENIPANTFIMGDFNGFFTNEEPFTFMTTQFSAVRGTEELPLSCCYNFNSSCPENMRSVAFKSKFNETNSGNQMKSGVAYLCGKKERYDSLMKEAGKKDPKKKDTSYEAKLIRFAKSLNPDNDKKFKPLTIDGDYLTAFKNGVNLVNAFNPEQDLFQVSSVDHECVIVRSLDKNRDQSLDGNARDMGYRGKKDYYVLKGDFVLGHKGTVIESAEIVKRKESDGVSTRSDHEMVNVIFKLLDEEVAGGNAKGGRRVKRGRTKKNRVKTSKKSKRNNLNK